MSIEKIWVLAESANGVPISTTLELLTQARSMAPTVEAVGWGPGTSEAAATLGDYGANTLYDIGDIGEALPGPPVAAAIAALVASGNRPDAILVPATYDGRDIAGRLSARLDLPVITNVVGLGVEGEDVLSQHGIFGGTQVATAHLTGEKPWIFVVRAKSFSAEPAGAGAAQVQPAAAPTDLGATNSATVIERHVEEQSGPKLDEADVVVSGGRGLGSAENYAMVEELAKLLKGAAGASRAIVDAGWVPYSHQVGQTGKTVKPTLYIACGISGATQHMVGMKGAKNIVAINKDQDAPIFSIADLGIVGDVHKVVPKLIEALKARS
ncbi:MAG TPA: electron transfer flavoprotein subunit alpha/FixB family protein [Acidimicrobiales bacterium]|nr:electron transfer flavoprotein subunit alpha/FixB family protein [Acidimicrobiales bacterium]